MFRDSQASSGFSVDDLAKAKAFYGGTLGLEVTEGPMGDLHLHLAGGTTIFVYVAWFKDPAGNVLSVIQQEPSA